MADTEVKKIICSSCGAEFEDTLPKCPYCGSLNYKGAEAEYLGKLESMRQDMQQLEQVPEKELKKKLKKKTVLPRRVIPSPGIETYNDSARTCAAFEYSCQ